MFISDLQIRYNAVAGLSQFPFSRDPRSGRGRAPLRLDSLVVEAELLNVAVTGNRIERLARGVVHPGLVPERPAEGIRQLPDLRALLLARELRKEAELQGGWSLA